MSLTSALKAKRSPLLEFMHERFPGASTFARQVNRELKSETTLRPAVDVPFSTIATALDYRIRYYFAITPFQELVAWNGASMLCARPIVLRDGIAAVMWISSESDVPVLSQELVDDFFDYLKDALNRINPPKKRLERAEEEAPRAMLPGPSPLRRGGSGESGEVAAPRQAA